MNKKLIGSIAVIAIVASALVGYTMKNNSTNSGNDVQIKPVADIARVADLPNRVKDIRALAWQKMTANRDNGYKPMVPVETLIGPNSLDCSEGLIQVIHSVEKTFQGVKMPKKVHLLIGNSEKDKQWFEAETRKLLAPKFLSFQGSEMINPETVDDKGIGVLWADDPCNSTTDISREDGVRVAHGFLHVLQTNQFVSKPDDWARWGEVPRWILEGGATLAATYYAHGETQEGYLKRPENFYELYQLGKDFYPDYIKYTPGERQPWAHTDKWDNYRAYDVGSYICEILIALKGPESIIDLYGDYLKTRDFDKSFANIYGTSWTDAYPIISTVTYDVIEESTRLVMPYIFTEKKSA
jgi:hypothetical protein